MILGLVSLPLFFCAGGLLALVGLILGIVAAASINKAPDLRKGAGLAYTGVIASTLCLIGSAFFWVNAVKTTSKIAEEGAGSSSNPGIAEAERNIQTAKDGKIAHGNSPEAEKLAGEFGSKMKTLRETFFSESRKPGVSLTGGSFLTHCELHETTCAFLVHVPDFRKFDGDAKKSLNDLAWMVAQQVLADHGFPEEGRLAVGLKGVILYDDIRIGRHVKPVEGASGEDADLAEGVENHARVSSDLVEFFPTSAPPTAPEISPTNSSPTPTSPRS